MIIFEVRIVKSTGISQEMSNDSLSVLGGELCNYNCLYFQNVWREL